ncbi:2-octaprenyl-6-methoxyphenyl hydroxylase [Shewanella abyssi]|uniref:2-octaprenyl-6-methoxyphenyl hydroxylase n=1 Tax=Shewanella abyssi TaxID=311789 RepID=UPI00200BD69A|nr:2-octaprenyl-6-methoxyphenyl hydroxylase [Shewanella abyssi]MCL1049056.1 2-octaprenyl-6-methoxyphenyl hydroxylase [Shewanella abyssi]
MTNTTAVEQVDIAIVGGAMVGATLALGLAHIALQAKRPLKIALIEAHRPNNDHPGFDARSIAISHGSIFELKKLQIWPHIAALASKINHIHISERGNFGMTELSRDDFQLPYLGQVVELEAVGQQLFNQLAKSDIQLYCPASLHEVEAQANQQLLTLDTGQQIAAKLLVAADGLNSKVRQAFKQPLEQVDFQQTAIITNIQTEQPHQGWAFERFTQTGPLALLPMSNRHGENRLSMVWALSPQEAEHLLKVPKAEFIEKLQSAFGYRAGRFMDIGERFSYPLMLSYMPRPIYHRTVFLGNAAQTLHPIAGQGFNLGLRDVVSLLQVIKQSLSHSDSTVDVGLSQVTHDYLARRNADRDSTMTSIELLVRGFSNDYWPLVIGRNLGLRLLSWFPPLKAPVARRAMGWVKS